MLLLVPVSQMRKLRTREVVTCLRFVASEGQTQDFSAQSDSKTQAHRVLPLNAYQSAQLLLIRVIVSVSAFNEIY